MRKQLAVIFGGRSVEHDVSVITGLQLMEHVDPAVYDVIPIYISRDGGWYTGDLLRNFAFLKDFNPYQCDPCYIPPDNSKCLVIPAQSFFRREKRYPLDVVIPALHGMNGEDGTLQGVLELSGIPYTSVSVMGSAVGMDKIAMKALFRGYGFPVLDGVVAERSQWQNESATLVRRIMSELSFPMFVKPANLGSSIGISRATDETSLREALEVAFHYDRRVLVERGLNKPTEVNCSALGFGGNVQVSLCEEPVAWEEFLSFDDKYLHGGGGKGGVKGSGAKGGGKMGGMQSMQRKIPAPISDEHTLRIRTMTEAIFRALDCKGVVRIDYMIDHETDELYVNEINTIPGSFAFYLWEPLGTSYRSLINQLVQHPLLAHQEKEKNSYAYASRLLSDFKPGSGSKAGKR